MNFPVYMGIKKAYSVHDREAVCQEESFLALICFSANDQGEIIIDHAFLIQRLFFLNWFD